MKLLVSGTTQSVERLGRSRPDRLGVLLTPDSGNRISWACERGLVWAADNACFKGLNVPKWMRFLDRLSDALAAGLRPLWVACPDVVADAQATRERFEEWEPELRRLGLPVAFVGQDGLNYTDIPWGRLDAFFVGGSTEWKLSDDAAEFTLEAKARGKVCHFGRVNSFRRVQYIARRMRDGELWCDSIDGSGFSQWGDINIPKAIRWIDSALACKQLVMFGGNA